MTFKWLMLQQMIKRTLLALLQLNMVQVVSRTKRHERNLWSLRPLDPPNDDVHRDELTKHHQVRASNKKSKYKGTNTLPLALRWHFSCQKWHIPSHKFLDTIVTYQRLTKSTYLLLSSHIRLEKASLASGVPWWFWVL